MDPFLKRGLSVTALSLCALNLWNCSQDQGAAAEFPAGKDMAQVFLKMNYADTPQIDSLVIDGIGADTLHLKGTAEKPYFDVDVFPGDWNFQARLYANGSLMQTGEVSAKLEAGSSRDLSIQMHALAGFIYVEIPLGFGNPTGIASGKLALNNGTETFTYPMEMAGSTAVFRSAMLPLDTDYSFTLSLMDSSGVEIYRTEDNFHLDENTPVPNLQIKSLRAKISLAIKLAEEVKMEFNLALPAGSRRPSVGDMIITEVFSAPNSSDTSQYEFVEIYNGSLDTLQLDGCTLGLTSVASKGWNITASSIAPTQALVLGNVLSENTPEEFRNTDSWASGSGLNNSNGAVVLQCNGSVLDSLYYRDSPDSIHTNVVPALGSSKYGQSAQLNLPQYENRRDSSAWCLGLPTPGIIHFCD